MWEEIRCKLFDGIVVVFFALFGGAARFVIAPPVERTLLSILSSLIVAGFSGILVWAALDARQCEPLVIAAGTGIAGLLGDDILKGLLALGKIIKEDPSSIISKWIGSKKKGDD